MKEDNILSTNDAAWRAKARLIMEKNEEFVVIGFDHAFDQNDATALAQEMGYWFRHDLQKRQAIFKPKTA